jgi:uncharacterized phage protein gp47/JayE
MSITLQSYNEILGKLVRKIIADTPVNDVNTGSVLLTLLEAVAAQDFENNASILSVLETLNIDALKNLDLDARAADYGLTRRSSVRATGFIKIIDTSITKRTTTLYAVKPAPIAGDNKIYVNDASGWGSTGDLYIGRGTPQFEGPIPYTSIISNGSFYTINLGSTLQKDHLASDIVIDRQGTSDRLISAGTVVKIPLNNLTPEIRYQTLRDEVLAAGEDFVDGVAIVAESSGMRGNAGINTIVQFESQPFDSAAVTNTSSLTDGRDVESDDELRERIKNYASTLARGTRAAILAAIIGVSDSTDGKQVSSAVITEPPAVGYPSIVYIDDGSGFQPSFTGQSVDVLLSSAVGDEQFLQLSNFPLPRPQVVNQVSGPIELADGMVLRISVDYIEEEIVFSSSNFSNISAATLPEVVVAINDQATENGFAFRCRLAENSSRLLLYPTAHDAEYIQVSDLRESDDAALYANLTLKFPTNKYSYITLYRNNTLLTEKESSALLETDPSPWGINSPGTLILQVDGTPPQTAYFTLSDLGASTWSSATLSQWASTFNLKFAGITAVTTSSGRLQIRSNKTGSSSLRILSGDYIGAMFGSVARASIGTESQFALNRQTGNLQLKVTLSAGDTITAGTTDAKGSVVSNETNNGTYNLSTDSFGRPAELVVGVDGANVNPRADVAVSVGTTLTILNPSPGSGIMRVMSNSLTALQQAQINDFIYIVSRGATPSWVSPSNTGLFKIIAKGSHLSAGADTYVDVANVGVVAGGPFSVILGTDVQVFSSDVYPQIWRGSYLPTPASASLKDVANSFNSDLLNVKGSIFKTTSVKATSTTENGGSIGVPVSVGNMTLMIPTGQDNEFGNQSHVASRVTDKDLFSLFKRTAPTSSNVWLDRFRYSTVKDYLDSNSVPNPSGYSEILEASGTLNSSTASYDDIVNITSGANKSQFRSIREFLVGDEVGTQISLPKTELDYLAGDQVELLKSLTIAADDSIVFIVDGDAVNNTINVNMWRTGRINNQYIPSATSFSADDADNESGVNFGNLQVWPTSSGTDFSDYAVWMKSRNWYRTGGALANTATMIVRAKEYGPTGDKYRFSIEYPAISNQTAAVKHDNTPDYCLTTYTFASGSERGTGIVGGTTFKVTSVGAPTNYVWRYSFVNVGVDLAFVVVGDILSLSGSSGVSAANRGTFYINAVDPVNRTLDIYNPNGAATSVGLPEITSATAVADIPGTAMQQTIATTAQGSGIGQVSTQDYFVLYDDIGKVAFWYDVQNAGVPAPTVSGAYRYVKISTVVIGDTADNIATKTAVIIDSDLKFSATVSTNVITVVNSFVGPVTAGSNGPGLAFVFATPVPGVPEASLGGKYFKIHDQAGSVAVWYNTGSSSLPPHGCDRAIQVSISSGSSASAVATATASFVGADPEFSASALGAVITITDAENGSRIDATDGGAPYSTGFTISTSQQGVNDGVEGINATSACSIFPLASNDVGSICETINTSQTLTAVAVGDSNLVISKATREDTYSYTGNSSALAYGHNPNPSTGLNSYASLYDGESFVQTFSNSNPQFVLKKALLLQGVVPSIYAMNTCPNPGTVDTGEYFKLIPKTAKNIKHHFTQKALSQLPIVADVDIADNFRRIQIKSKKLGTEGGVEIVGGRANIGEFSIAGDAIVAPGLGSISYLEMKTSAFPAAINAGDMVEIYNDLPAKRRSRLNSSSSIDVASAGVGLFDYRFNPRNTSITPFTNWTITDVSSLYGKVAGVVWRWAHEESGAKLAITAKTNGAVVTVPNSWINDGSTQSAKLYAYEYANGTSTSKLTFALAASAKLAVSPDQGSYFYFVAQDGTKYAVWFNVDGNGTPPTAHPQFTNADYKIRVDVLSTDSLNLLVSKMYDTLTDLLSPAAVAFMSDFDIAAIPGTDLSDVSTGDLLNAYGTFTAGWNSANKSNAAGEFEVSGFPIVAVNSTSRYVDLLNPTGIAMPSANYSGLNGTVSISPTPTIRFRLKHAALSTRYRVESLGALDLFRVVRASGDSPYFADCGVAVDDFVILSGSSFNSSNLGRFRVLAVDNNSIVIQNPSGVEELNTYMPLNLAGSAVTWTAGSNSVVGSVGQFANVTVGSWVKKTEDSIDKFAQVASLSPATPSLATTVTLGQNYRGTTGSATGIATSFTADVGLGSMLMSADDLQVFEGDSVVVGDSLIADPYTNYNWFNQANTGARSIVSWGSSAGLDTPYLSPYVTISNPNGIAESNRQVGLKLDSFYILEGDNFKYKTVRQVYNAAINQTNFTQRIIYATPSDRSYKMSDSHSTKIKSLGKLGFPLGSTTGVDGYLYYTGLMRTVQRIIDGYEPDAVTYPGQRAVGSSIEVLPPLIQQVSMSLKITTRDGVNLTDITNEIKSTVINYVSSLGVGEDVILSEVIARVKNIIGIEAITFTTPSPTQERIAVADDEKAFITPELISLA